MRRQAIRQHQALFPKSTPPGLNYAVVTGTLIADPIKVEGPGGEKITLLEIKFPVANPEDPRLLWTHAFYDVEVPGRGRRAGHRGAAQGRLGARGWSAQRAARPRGLPGGDSRHPRQAGAAS
jgi:hypothetical protein